MPSLWAISQVLLPEVDQEWVTRHSPQLEFWQGHTRQLLPGLDLIRLGGHFPGSSVLLWRQGCEGRGLMLTGRRCSSQDCLRVSAFAELQAGLASVRSGARVCHVSSTNRDLQAHFPR